MKEAFLNIRFRRPTLELIDHVNGIVDEYQALGFTLTLRQLFYQFVSRPALGLANTLGDYKRLGRTVTDARRAGLIDWDAIEDRTRNVRFLPTWVGAGRDASPPAPSFTTKTSGPRNAIGPKSGSRRTLFSA